MQLTDHELLSYEFIERFKMLGSEIDQMKRWAEDGIQQMEQEPEELELLIETIKNYSIEKKA